MRRILPVLSPALVVIALALLPLGAALAGETKEFKTEGVDWTLPDGWSFGPVSSEEKSAGFFAKVSCDSASVQMWAYVAPTDGLSLDERVGELAQAGGEGMGTAAKTAVMDTTLSGVKGKVVIQRIQANGGATAVFRKYVIVANGKFYQLLMRCWHDAHKDVTDGINAVRAGFRLKKGAGGKDAPEKLTEVDGSGSSDGGTRGSDGADGADGGVDWPAKGPKLDGDTVKMDNHNMHWTLGDKTAFKWAGAIENGEAESGRFVWALARVERKKQEFEKDTPDHNFGMIDLIVEKAPPGFKAADWVRGAPTRGVPPVRDIVGRKFWGLLTEIQAAKTRTKDEVAFGNHTAAWIKMEGKRGDKRRVVMLFPVVLRGKLYVVRSISWGHTDAYKTMAPQVGRALKGIKFLRTDEPVRGPLLGMIPDYAGDRGENADKEKEYTGPGYVFEKPEGLNRIKVSDSMNRDLKYVGEGRTEDGKAYIYFEIRVISLKVPYGAPMPDEEKFIEKRAQDWEAGAGPEADLGRGKKLKFKKGSFARKRGLEYEFAGHLDDEPVIEQGYVVKHKQNLYWIKMQFIGKDAEDKLKKLGKSIEKGMKFSR